MIPSLHRDPTQAEQVALRPAADDDRVRPLRDVGVVPEPLAPVDLGDVDLDHRPVEGVERVEHLEFLRKRGCDEVQGYLFGKPLPPDQFAGLLERQAIENR